MADEKQTSALMRRHEQLKRWEDSETNKEPAYIDYNSRKVKFQDGCVFLAACSSGDRAEVKKLLERGADINTANVDGLTALHQACIDDNLDMVEFLVENGADVDVCDNEGWTPLHATASCGFTEIARYLIQIGANVAAVNNDGDLPFDICEEDDMEKLLQEEMEKQGVDAEAARREEEDQMMADANQWLSTKEVNEIKHHKTGATALHVAAAKGYVKVISVLLQAGVDVNDTDNDGWAPLHAAAHWGQEEACKLLAEHMCDMDAKNKVGQSAFDVADTDMIKLLEELKVKQASLKDQQRDLQKEIISTKGPTSRRRSSVTRMSVEQKQNVILKTVEQERKTLDNAHVFQGEEKEEEKVKSSSSSGSDEESSESETERINKQNEPPDRDKPPIMATVEITQPPHMPKIEETSESPEKENLKNLVTSKNKDNDVIDLSNDTEVINLNNDTEALDKPVEKTESEKEKANEKEVEKDKDTEKDKERETIIEPKVSNVDKDKEGEKIENVPPKKDKEPLARTNSAPPPSNEDQVPKISINSRPYSTGENDTVPSWRAGVRKTGSSSMVLESINKVNEADNLPRSASSSRVNEDNKQNILEEPVTKRRPFLSSSSVTSIQENNQDSSSSKPSVTDRYQGNQQSRSISTPYHYSSSSSSSSYQTAYVPYYRRVQEQNEKKEREKASREKDKDVSQPAPMSRISNRITAPPNLLTTTTASVSTTLSPVTTVSITTPAITTVATAVSTVTTPTSTYSFRRSYEPPKRDEETETQRKARAKRARETRRSTQGVTLEEIKQAEKEIKKSIADKSKAEALKQTQELRDKRTSEVEERLKDTSKDSEPVSLREGRTRISHLDNSTDISGGSSVLGKSNSTEDSNSLSRWRSSREPREEDSGTSRSSSFRRSREIRDLTSSQPASSFYSDSNYIPRNQRNALSSADSSNTSLSSNLTRSTSLRARLRNGESDSIRDEFRRDRIKDTEKDKDEKSNEKDKGEKEEKRESSSIRARRQRRERRSTGITYDATNEDDKDKENKEESKEDNKTETEDKNAGSRYNRYGSASDMPSHLTSDRDSRGHSTRPSSYSEFSRSTPALEVDYKKLYEDEKLEKERLKRELDHCKKELTNAKTELDRLMKRSEAAKVAETNDKRERRALERKLSELEEEVKKMDQIRQDNQRLKEENGALIRVISKLSK